MTRSESQDFYLKAGDAIARFSVFGAECREWSVAGRRLTWNGDPATWAGIAPVLFPVCGWSRDGTIRVGDAKHPMPVHGFAAQSLFEANQVSACELRFTLSADADTRTCYPYEFTLEVSYRLSETALEVLLRVGNAGSVPMPYACGLHPGFLWDGGEGAHHLLFEAEERGRVPIIAPGGLFSQETRPVALRGRVLDLGHGLFSAEALCFLDTASRRFSFDGPRGRLDVHAPDFPHLVLWSRDGAPFLAIESWTGTGDPEGFRGDFSDRPSMIHLPAGERREHRVSYEWHAAERLAEAANSA
ncbi:MAG: Aldose 1-epimerase [Hyphomicrobiales bacterium]|nr:Aldose 1-epimerase [Hyphomicrobiales bacterium]